MEPPRPQYDISLTQAEGEMLMNMRNGASAESLIATHACLAMFLHMTANTAAPDTNLVNVANLVISDARHCFVAASRFTSEISKTLRETLHRGITSMRALLRTNLSRTPVSCPSDWKRTIERANDSALQQKDRAVESLRAFWPTDYEAALYLGESVLWQMRSIQSETPSLALLSSFLAYLTYKSTAELVTILSSKVIPKIGWYQLAKEGNKKGLASSVCLRNNEEGIGTIERAYGRLEHLWIELEMSKLVEQRNDVRTLPLFSLLELRDDSFFVNQVSDALDSVVWVKRPRGWRARDIHRDEEQNLLRVWVQNNWPLHPNIREPVLSDLFHRVASEIQEEYVSFVERSKEISWDELGYLAFKIHVVNWFNKHGTARPLSNATSILPSSRFERQSHAMHTNPSIGPSQGMHHVHAPLQPHLQVPSQYPPGPARTAQPGPPQTRGHGPLSQFVGQHPQTPSQHSRAGPQSQYPHPQLVWTDPQGPALNTQTGTQHRAHVKGHPNTWQQYSGPGV